jgi:RNA polymerase sigma-70 factor (ECF subfamily)
VPLSLLPRVPSLEIPLDAVQAPTSVRDEVLMLFDACAPAVRRYVRSCGVAPDVADDIVQETFVALFQHLHKGGGRENLRGWLMQVGHNLTLKHRRTEGRRMRWQRPWSPRVENVCDPAAPPDAACVARQDQHRLRAVLLVLPERDRQCVALRAEGLRYRDIASTLGISLGAVAKSMARAMARLAAVLER